MILVSKSENSLSSAIELLEFVASPRLMFGVVVFQVSNGSVWIISFFDSSFVSSVDIVMERVFEGDSVELSLGFDNESTNNRLIGSPGVGDKPGSVEKSRSDNVGFEVFFDSAFLHFPADDLNVGVSIVFDLDLMETVAVPVVTLSDISVVEVVVNVVVMSEVVGGVDPGALHSIKFISEDIFTSTYSSTVFDHSISKITIA